MAPMETFRVELTAPLDPDALHAYLEDATRQTEWRFDVASSVLVGGLHGGVGARYDQRIADGGEERQVELELTDSERPTMIAFHAVDGHATRDVGLAIEAEGAGSRVILDVQDDWHGKAWHRRPRGGASTEETAVRYGRGLADQLGGELA